VIDEGELRRRFPEIPWDQPVTVTVAQQFPTFVPTETYSFWACRYCIAMKGLKAQDALKGRANVYMTRDEALDHVEQAHHD
jgi:hypothetical protein